MVGSQNPHENRTQLAAWFRARFVKPVVSDLLKICPSIL